MLRVQMQEQESWILASDRHLVCALLTPRAAMPKIQMQTLPYGSSRCVLQTPPTCCVEATDTCRSS